MESENPTHEKKSSPLKWIGLLLLVVILVAAAFVAGRLMNRAPQLVGPGGPMIMSGNGDPGEMMSISINLVPAEELPKTQPDAVGIFNHREDNSFFISTGNMGVLISGEVTSGSGEVSSGASVVTSGGDGETDGAVVEIVVNSDTIVYKEVTAPPNFSDSGETQAEIQQEVAPGDIEDIGENSSLTVWGRKVGDRIIADILLYSDAMVMMSPAP